MAWEMLGTANFVGGLASRLPAPPLTHLTPSFRGVTIRDLEVEGCRMLDYVQGIPESPAKHILIENVWGDTRRDEAVSAYGHYKPSPKPYVIDMVDADGVTLRNFQVVTAKEQIRIVDVRNLTMEDLQIDCYGEELDVEISGEMTEHLKKVGCNF